MKISLCQNITLLCVSIVTKLCNTWKVIEGEHKQWYIQWKEDVVTKNEWTEIFKKTE